MNSLLLTYNLDTLTDTRLRVLCRRLSIRVRAVAPEEYGEAVGALAGIPTAKAAEDAPQGAFHDRMIVMCNLLSPQFNALLRGMRDEGVPRIDLKCVLTPTNVAWNSFQLREELAREHEAMKQAREQE